MKQIYFLLFMIVPIIFSSCATNEGYVQGDAGQSQKISSSEKKVIEEGDLTDYGDDLTGLSSESFKSVTPRSFQNSKDYYPEDLYGASDSHKNFRGEILPETLTAAIKNDELADLSSLCSHWGKRPSSDEWSDFEQKERRLSRSYKKNPAFWNVVGVCFYKAEKNKLALFFYNKALEIKPDYTPALNNVALIYLNEGEDQKGFLALNKAKESSPFSVTPQFNALQLSLKYFRFADARKMASLLEREGNQYIVSETEGVIALLKGDAFSSIDHFKKVPLRDLGLSGKAFYALALFRSGNRDAGINVFQSIDASKLSGNQVYQYERLQSIVR
jgi:tetratricopeptide (TPR) repeat protein